MVDTKKLAKSPNLLTLMWFLGIFSRRAADTALEASLYVVAFGFSHGFEYEPLMAQCKRSAKCSWGRFPLSLHPRLGFSFRVVASAFGDAAQFCETLKERQRESNALVHESVFYHSLPRPQDAGMDHAYVQLLSSMANRLMEDTGVRVDAPLVVRLAYRGNKSE